MAKLGLGYANSIFTICTTIFVFSSKTSFFAGLGALFRIFFESFYVFDDPSFLGEEPKGNTIINH